MCRVPVLAILSLLAWPWAAVAGQTQPAKAEASAQIVRDFRAAVQLAEGEQNGELAEACQGLLTKIDAALKEAMGREDLAEANRISAARKAWEKSATAEAWGQPGAGPLTDLGPAEPKSPAVKTAKHGVELAAKKIAEAYAQKVQSARRTAAGRLDQAKREALKRKDLEEANRLAGGARMIEREAEERSSTFPRGAVIAFTFDRQTFDQANGKRTVRDLSGHRNDLAVATSQVAEGIIGGGLQLTAGQDFLTGANVGISGKSPRSLSFWVKFAKAPAGRFEAIAGWGGKDLNTGFIVKTYEGRYILWACGVDNDWNPSRPAEPGVWRHHVLVYDGTTVHWWLNGEELGSGFKHEYNTADGPLHVGGTECVIDELAVFDRPLTREEIVVLGRGKVKVTRPRP
jgi:hypothetical protein